MTRPKISRLVIAGLTAVLTAGLGLALAGCAGAGHPNQDASPGSARALALPVWREFTACVRSHGVANVPDPQVDDNGQATWPGLSQAQIEVAQQQVAGACDAILQKLPAAAQPGRQITRAGAGNAAALRAMHARSRPAGLPRPQRRGHLHDAAANQRRRQDNAGPRDGGMQNVYNGSIRTG